MYKKLQLLIHTLLLLALAIPFQVSAATQSKFSTYVVKRGDTLYAIANHYRTTVTTIRNDNHIRNVSKIAIGQHIKIRKSVAAADPKVKKILHATLTAYTAGYESTGKTRSHPAYGITSSGAHVREGRTIAVDPRVIPIGAKVYIEGVGMRVAEDTGSAIRGAKIDVYMEDLDDARQFGVKHNRKVYVFS
jgi:3D (Asp-Asp-Asp) domain-containing protein